MKAGQPESDKSRNASEAVKKSATFAKARTTPFVEQRLAMVNSSVLRFLHRFSVFCGALVSDPAHTLGVTRAGSETGAPDHMVSGPNWGLTKSRLAGVAELTVGWVSVVAEQCSST